MVCPESGIDGDKVGSYIKKCLVAECYICKIVGYCTENVLSVYKQCPSYWVSVHGLC